MSPLLLLTVLALAACTTGDTTLKPNADITTKSPGIQPLPARLPGSVTPPTFVRDTRQISVTTTPKTRLLGDSSKTVPATTLADITPTPTFPRRRRDTEDEDEKTFGNQQRPILGAGIAQLFATRPNFGLPNLFGNRRPGLTEQDSVDTSIQSQPVPAIGLQTLGATQFVTLSNQPDKMTATQTASQLGTQTATLTGSQSKDQTSTQSTLASTNFLADATSTTPQSNAGLTSQSTTTELSRKTRDVETEAPFPKSRDDENEYKPTTTGTTGGTEFKPYTLIASLRTTQKPLGVFSQTALNGNSGSSSAFASASNSPSSEGVSLLTSTQNKDSIGDGWYKPATTELPIRDSFLQRQQRSADQGTQKPQSGSSRPLTTTTTKPQLTRDKTASQSSSKATQKPSGLPSTTPRSRTSYPTPSRSQVRPVRSAVTQDSQQKTTKNIPTTTAQPAKRDSLKTTPKPITPPKRTARDTKPSSSTTQKPQNSNKKNASH